MKLEAGTGVLQPGAKQCPWLPAWPEARREDGRGTFRGSRGANPADTSALDLWPPELRDVLWWPQETNRDFGRKD